MKLRPYQSAAVAAIEEAWKTSAATLMVLPTGTGKTVAFAHILDRLPRGRAMVIAHREELIWQASDKIHAVTGEKPDVEMADLRASTTLYGKAWFVVSSVQTQCAGRDGGRMGRFAPEEFAVLVVDEAHHATSPTYRRVIDHYRQNPALKVLGCTATPDRHDEQALGQIFESVAYDYEILDAINDGWLVPIRQRAVVVKDLDLSSVRTTAGDLNQGDLSKVMEDLEYEEGLHGVASPTIDLAAGRKTLVFAASVAHADRLCEIFNRHRPDSARFVCGTTPKEERRAMLRDYAAGRFQILTNVGVATEGFDDPGIQVIVMARPTKSRALYAQMAGRGTRPLPGLVDRYEAPENRTAAIASSAKPACIAEGQRVLTNTGLVPIERVTTDMLVWDGIAFVSHDGPISQGKREVICYARLVATADHRVWTEEGWKTFGRCAGEQIAIGVTGLDRTTIRQTDGCFRRGASCEAKTASLGGMFGLRSALAERLYQLDAEKGGLPPLRTTATRATMADQTVWFGQVQVHQPRVRPLPRLWRSRDRISLCPSFGNGHVDTNASWAASGTYDRPDQQRWPLRTREPSVGNSLGSTVESTSEKVRVWDLLNAGPRHRYTVEGLLVSNCEIIDFVGNSGRHKLISTADILGGTYADDVVARAREIVEKAAGAAVDMGATLLDAQRQLAEERERERRRELKVAARWVARDVDPFDVLGIEPVRERGWDKGRVLSPKMAALLEKQGVSTHNLTFAEGRRLCAEICKRFAEKKCSFKQARLLARHGYDPGASFVEARKLIDGLAANGWRRPEPETVWSDPTRPSAGAPQIDLEEIPL